MSIPAIQVEAISKRYRIGAFEEEKHDTFGGAAMAWLKSPFVNFRNLQRLSKFSDSDETDVIWALRDVSFDIPEGEAVGIIGRNGAGKSTLLKILARITPPSSGRALLNGRVASLLEVVTGFHPDLTGRENLYLNGAVLGMTNSEIDRKYDEILDFSGIEKFIDTPVKRYSSGMRVRLAFAVAAHLEPEILLVDEVLAVGDAQFQRKCLGKMGDIAGAGRTVILVSHNMASIEALCRRAVVLEGGYLAYDGDAKEAVNHYLSNQVLSLASGVDLLNHPDRIGAETAPIFQSIRLLNKDGVETSAFEMGETVVFEIVLDTGENSLDSPLVSMGIERRGAPLCTLSTRYMVAEHFTLSGRMVVRCTWNPGWLVPGDYALVNLTLKAGLKGERLDHVGDVLAFEIVARDVYGTGKIARPGSILVPDGKWQFLTVDQ